MRKLLFSLASLLCCLSYAVAQEWPITYPDSVKITGSTVNAYTKEGKWIIVPVGKQIVKVTFKPKGEEKLEQISDAVIVKPVSTKPTPDKRNEELNYHWKEQQVSATFVNNSLILKTGNQTLTCLGFFKQDGYRGLSYSISTTEYITGGGERAVDMNRNGMKLPYFNRANYAYGIGAEELNFGVPVLLSEKGYGLFVDNPSKGYFDIGKSQPGKLMMATTSGALEFYVFGGTDFKQLTTQFSTLTGKQSLPPHWVFGNIMSRFGYTSQKEVLDISQQMLDAGIPVDAVVLDLFWFGDQIKGSLGNLEFVNKQAWPNPTAMIQQLKKKNVNTILITEPYILENTRTYQQAKPFFATDSAGKPFTLTDFYFGQGGLLDLFRKDAQQWFFSQYKKQNLRGVAGWWGDLGEPERHPEAIYHNLKDLGFKRRFAANEVHNIYGHYWIKSLSTNYKAAYPNVRLFNLQRSGYAGSQRYQVFPWTGDVGRTWAGYQAQLPTLLGMSLSGLPYVHSDAGGFALGDKDPELYLRWLQFAVYTPVLRPHGTALYDKEATAISYPSEAVLMPEPFKSHAKQIINWRLQMLPYNYSVAYEHTQKGFPLMRPMNFERPSDKVLQSIQDQYFWGHYLMVAPVLEKGQTKRKVYLPKGTWLCFTDTTLRKGGEWIEENVAEYQMPVYMQEGGFMPFVTQPMKSVADYKKNPEVTLLHLPGLSPTKFLWYEDDGNNANSLSKKQYELITCESTGQGGTSLIISMKSNNGSYVGKPDKRNIRLVIGGISFRPRGVRINGTELKTGVRVFDEVSRANGPNVGYYRMEVPFQFTGLERIEIFR